MWYMILGRERDGALPARLEARPAHRARLQQRAGEGRLTLAGPLPGLDAADPGPAGFTGSHVVA